MHWPEVVTRRSALHVPQKRREVGEGVCQALQLRVCQLLRPSGAVGPLVRAVPSCCCTGEVVGPRRRHCQKREDAVKSNVN
jgi:hypothetical protein